MPIKIPVVQTGLEASIQAAAQKAGKSLKINMGSGAKSIEGLSQPLGRITGKADQFTKSMEAANARVLAFGASVGVLSAVTRGFQNLVVTTIEVEKSLASINSILGTSEKQLKDFGKTIFDVAKNTEQSFDTVANAALELSRQGLSAAEVQKRLSDSLILSRLSGLGAAEAVAGLTAAINSFNKEGLSSAEVLNKLSAAAVSAAVSERDLIEGIKRSGSVAVQAGVSFDELVGVITAVQKTTARGGAVIGNSFKTIFTRIQSIDKLETMQDLGVQVTDAGGQVLGATKLIQNLSKVLGDLPDAKKLQIAENLVGKFQIAPFLAILEDYNKETSTAISVTQTASNAFNEAYSRNVALNQTLSAAINEATVSLKELANTLGEIGVTDSLKNILGFFNSLVGDIKEVLDGEGAGGDFARGIVKGIGAVISGPGLAIFGAIILKLTADLAKFGVGSLKTFFGLNRAAQEQATLQGQIASTLLGNESIQKQILAIENSQLSVANKRKAQVNFFTTALNEQVGIMTRMQGIAATIAPGVRDGTRKLKGRGAGGFIPNYNAVIGYGSESSDISKGVGGAPSSAKPVTIPNFNFGGGQKGTMIANNSEYMVPNFAGGDGSAIFNQDMVSSMGLPAGAKKIGAAGGYIPNFAKKQTEFAQVRTLSKKRNLSVVNKLGKDFVMLAGDRGGDDPNYYTEIKYKDGSSVGVTVPSYRIKPGKGDQTPQDTEFIGGKLKTAAIDVALDFARSVSGNPKLPKGVNAKLKSSITDDKVASTAGNVFEAGITSLLTSDEFLDYSSRKSGSRIDMPYSQSLYKKFGVEKGQGLSGAEIKSNFSGKNSAAQKFADVLLGLDVAAEYREGSPMADVVRSNNLEDFELSEQEFKDIKKATFIGKGPVKQLTRGDVRNYRGRSSRGYIPNFAGGLGDAIARESSAGLPINQIRINQDPSLKNSSNPMGLAVTNTRDEPTGAIPNFAKSNIGMSDIGITSELTAAAKSLGQLNTTIDSLNKQIRKGKISQSDAEVELKKLTSTIKTNGQVRKKINDVSLKKLNTDAKVNKGNRDLLGTIFAVQAGMTALSGATEGAESATAKLVNSFSSAAASGATATFAIKGVGDFLESSGGKLGKFGESLSKASGYIGAAVAGIQIAGDAFDHFSGVSDFAADGMARVAKSAENAAFRLDEFDPEDQRGIQKEAAFQMENIKRRTAEENTIMGTLSTLLTQGLNFGSSLDFEGFDMFGSGKLEDTLNAAVQGALAGGADAGAVQAQLQKIAKDRDVTKDEISETQDLFDKLTQDAKRLNQELKKLTDGGIIQEEDLKFVQQFESKEEFLDAMNSSSSEARGFRRKLGLKGTREIQEKNLGQVFDAAKLKQEKDLDVIKAAQIEKDRITNTLAKQRVTAAIGMAKLEREILDTLELEFMLADKMGTLSNDQRKDKTQDILLAKENFDLRNATLDTMQKISEKSEGLSKIEGVNKQALNEIQSISKKRNITESDRVKALEAAKKLLEEDTGAVKASIEPLLIQLGITEKSLENVRKRSLKEAEINRLVAERNSIADAESTKNKTLLSTTKDEKLRGLEKRRNVIEDRISLRSGIPRSTREERRNVTDIAREKQSLAKINTEIKLETTAAAQREKALTIASTAQKRFSDNIKNSEISEFNKEISKLSGEKLISKFEELVKTTKVRGFGIDSETSEQFFKSNGRDPLVEEMAAFIKTSRETNKKDKLDNKKTIDTADNNLEISTRRTEKSFRQLIDNMQEQLSNTENLAQARIDNEISTDPVQRLKFRFNQKNLKERISALDPKNPNLELFRKLTEENEFAGQLIDASAQFAQNIGNAMTQAIANGESLKDLLLGAASGFFNTLSQAFMQKAVNNIISGFNAGGKVRGGSGNRDDVPALLTGGEFVMKKSSVNKYGSSFMAALNAGAVPTMQRGGLFTPGTYGQGAMKGKDNLLDFATQGFTTGNFDKTRGGSGFASVNLAPQSAALTMFGRRNSPAFQREQASKEAAFGLFTQQANKEAELKEQKKQASRGLLGSIGSALFSFGFNSLTDLFSKKATGGSIPYTSGVDTVPTMLSGGEFVMNAAATQRIGRGNLNALNSGAGGGSGEVVGKLDELIAVSDNSGETVINITVNSDGSSNSQGNGDDQQNSLATKIKDVVRQVIDDEKRLGGSLRQARA